MPEGDTVYLTARRLDAALAGYRLLPTGDEQRPVGHLGPALLDPHWSSEHDELALPSRRGQSR
jgi:hypothetical protein